MVQAATDYVRAAPREAERWGILGQVLLKQEFFAASGKAFDTAELLKPEDPRWPYFHVLAKAAIGEKRAAIPYLEKTVQLAGDEPDMPRLLLSEFLIEVGEYERAESHLAVLQARTPGHPRAALDLARIRLAQGRLDETAELLKSCAENRYTARSACLLLSSVYQRRGDSAAAEVAALKARAMPVDEFWPDPYQDVLAQFTAGRSALLAQAGTLASQKRFDEALQILVAITNAYPLADEPYYVMGWVLNKQLKPSEAERVLRKHLSLSPKSLRGHQELAVALIQQNKIEEAAAVLETGLAFNPDFGSFRVDLGYTYSRLGQIDKAIEAYRGAIKQYPARANIYVALATILAKRGEIPEAVRLTQQALKLDPSDNRAKALLKDLAPGS
jgi:tetratricopeptide (TPR) repeat protein